MKIYIIRHGETAMNSQKIVQGQTDEPLNENGRKLAHLTGQAMKGMHFDCCISSRLSRASETAEIVLKESGNDIPISFDDRILEMNFGDMEGVSISEIGDEGKLFYTNPLEFPGFPNGESIREVCARTQEFLKEIIAKDDDKTYLISTHGCAMRAMINFLFDDPTDFWHGRAPFNCSFSIVEAKGGSARLTDVDKVFYDQSLAVDLFKI